MHIKKVTLHRFKQFKSSSIDIKEGLSLVVGANNSGKSSILQALATWEFCKTLIEIERGREAWISKSRKAGVGMGISEFTPLQIPSMNHLWSNLKTNRESEKDGYTLKIGVHWDLDDGPGRFLEMGLSLANDRLFVKSMDTDLVLSEIQDSKRNPIHGKVPRVGYLPPFAGITDREGRLTPAMRQRLIGQGLSGGVIRNMLFDLFEENERERLRLRGSKSKISSSDLEVLRREDSWEILTKTMQQIFATGIKVVPFNERYHSYLKVECFKGAFENKKTSNKAAAKAAANVDGVDSDGEYFEGVEPKGAFKRFKNYNSRDLMVEGSGFLQWLSVYALSLSSDVDVLLLDEPDAHLNATLQKDLIRDLERIRKMRGKQVLLATHSPELIRYYDHDRILSITKDARKYLSDPAGKIGVLSGIGAEHTPTLHALMENKRMLILEAESDERFLKLLAGRAGVKWPRNVVSWFWPGKVSERQQLYLQLLKEIPGLVAISIRDRDDEPDNTVGADLIDKIFPSKQAGFEAMKWRRRHIENYLLCTAAIARASNKPESDVVDFFASHSLVLPANFTNTDVAPAIKDAHGKEIMTKENSVKAVFHVTRDDIAKSMEPSEICDDIKTFLTALLELSKPFK